MNDLEKIIFDENGNQIISTEKNGGEEIKTVKYGIIKLINDKNEYRVSFKTLLKIEEARKSGFTGTISITELNMSVSANQIIMAKSDVEKVKTAENFTNLPTSTVLLDKDMKISTKSRFQFTKEQESYYIAKAHYEMRDGEKQYYLQKDKIASLTKVEFDEGYEIITAVWRYGTKTI